MIKLAAEKNISKYLFPIEHRANQNLKYPVIIKTPVRCAYPFEGTGLGAEHEMMLDVIGTYVLIKTQLMAENMVNSIEGDETVDFARRILLPKTDIVKGLSAGEMKKELIEQLIANRSPEHGDKIPSVYYQQNGMRKPVYLKLNDQFLKRQLKFMRDYTSEDIWGIIKQIADTKIGIEYPVRLFHEQPVMKNKKDPNTGQWIQVSGFDREYINVKFDLFNNNVIYNSQQVTVTSSFFRLNDVKDHSIEQQKGRYDFKKKNRVMFREYDISFDTYLGYSFIQNYLSSYIDFIPESFYTMSNRAQLFYRHIILPQMKKNNRYSETVSHVRNRIGIMRNDRWGLRKAVDDVLDELEGAHLIKDPRKTFADGLDYRVEFTKLNWDEVTSENKSKENQ